MSTTDAVSGVTRTVVGLARTLRAAGVAASPDRVHECVRALEALDVGRRDHVYWAGRLTLCGSADELERYDRVFSAYFAGVGPTTRQRQATQPSPLAPLSIEVAAPSASEPHEHETETVTTAASRQEVLRARDFSALSPHERAEVHRLLAQFRLPGELRPSRRRRPDRRGPVDARRTVRAWMRGAGEPVRLRHEQRRHRPRRVVLLVDVSGSMQPYAEALLRFAHAAARGRMEHVPGTARTEAFTIGTRLTRITSEIAERDPDRALAAVSAAVPDWSGGTRLGELLKAFLDRWGQRGLARGAVVVMLSDGWERGDTALLAAQMSRLSRLAHRVVWANPLKARPGYEPTAAGMAAALPFVDEFVEGHSLEALEHLAEVVVGG